MRVLFFSMPDDMPFFSSWEFKVPSLAGGLLSANATGHDVWVADLCLRRRDVPAAVREAIRDFRPRVVGLSAMSFQYDTARHVARLIRREFPDIQVVLGGYHATLMSREISESADAGLFDFLIRGEGDLAFAQLLDTVERGGDLAGVRGVSFRLLPGNDFQHNPARELEDLERVRPPDRTRRLWSGYHYNHLPFELLETSRGCTLPCTFCSIRQMYGASFRAYSLDRVIADIKDASDRGARAMLISDDNITLDIPRFIELCKRIIHARLNHVVFIVQASSHGIASSEELVGWLDRANFRAVFLGMENVSRQSLLHMRKGDIVQKSQRAVELLHRHHIAVVGGIVFGFPWDGPEELRENFEFLRGLRIDFFGDQIITPYPKTQAREQQVEAGFVVNYDDFRWYNGFWANVRTQTLSADELLFWRCLFHRKYTERWMSPTIRTLFPQLWAFKHLVGWPLKSLHRAWDMRNSTLREHFEKEMTRFIMHNNFFGDRQPYRPFDEVYAHQRTRSVTPVSLPVAASASSGSASS